MDSAKLKWEAQTTQEVNSTARTNERADFSYPNSGILTLLYNLSQERHSLKGTVMD